MSESSDGGKSPSTLKSCCLLGCIGLALLAVVAVVGGGAWVGSFTSRFNEADKAREERLAQTAANPFAPAADGRIPSERLEAYLRVRRELLEPCSQLGRFFGEIERFDRHADGPEAEPTVGEALGIAWKAMQLPGGIAAYFEARNRLLVEQQMSLDEWRWYTVLAYRSGGGAFVPESGREHRSGERGSQGDHELVRRLLVQQLEAARAAGPEAAGADWIATLEAESERLDEAERSGWPWPEGLPERIAGSLRTRADELTATHCRFAEDFEIDEVQREGMSFHVE